jgi:uncharacterized protein
MQTMTCPGCGGPLVELERSGVTIDACRSCRGVWLDRGELDKLIEREARETAPDDDFMREPTGGSARRGPARGPAGTQPRKKKRGFLGEMFEFGD